MSGGGKSPKTQTISTGPPKWALPYLRGIFNDAQGLYQNAEFFPGQTYAGFSPEQSQAFDLQTQRALSGSGVNRAAQDQAESTLRGDFLYGGPGFNAAFDAASRAIIPQANSQFGRAGRTGSGLAATAQTQALGDAFSGLYNQERQRQLGFAGLSPTLAAQDYFDISQLANVGAQRQAMEQTGINEAMARHDFPFSNLQRYAGLIGPLLGSAGSQQTSPIYQNRAAGLLGGGLLGASLPGMFGTAGAAGASPALLGMGPWGWALGGALLGGLL